MSKNNDYRCTGNLTRDPEYKTISERELATFRIAVNDPIGNGREETSYHDIDAWGHHAKYAQGVDLVKGDRVTITGRIRQREWEDKNGSKRTSQSVQAETLNKVVRPPRRENNESSPAASNSGGGEGSGFDTF